jgi:hypothetical protein
MGKSKVTQQDFLLAAYEALMARHNGRISPAALLEAAKDPSSPFHDFFEWDDDEAAEQFRLVQASQIIRRWKGSLMRIDAETKTVKIETVRRVQSPASDRSRGGASYQTVEEIMADPQKREDMLQTVLRELAAYRRRYSQMMALSEVWTAIDDALETLAPSRLDTAAQAGHGVAR